MKNRLVILAAALLVILGVPIAPYAQDHAVDVEKSDQLKRKFAISLLRTINTAEVVDRTKFGSYSSWQTLLTNHSEYFDQFIAMHRRLLPDAHFADPPEILPGWNLRMNIHADGQGYDVLLRDMTVKKCGYAAVTNENAVIWQSKTIDCEI